MTTNLTTWRCTAILLVSVALLASCAQPRKAAQRRCSKADRHIAKAVWLCPDALARDSATVQLPPTSTELRLALVDSVTMDSVLAACNRIRMALEAELEHTKDSSNNTPGVASVPAAVRVLQRTVCLWETLTDTVNGMVITVRRSADGSPLLGVELLARTVKAPCPPAITRPPCPGLLDQLRSMGTSIVWIVLSAIASLYLLKRMVSMPGR